MIYNAYGTRQVEDATRRYNEVAENAPTYADSAVTRAARGQADYYAKQYADAVGKGYKSVYADDISVLANRYNNNKFNWNPEGSSEFQTQKDYYRREGEKAQENAQGAYSANTGGYSNSFAQSAGQRAYGQYMDALAEKIPALRSTALKNWNEQQDQTLNQISMLKGFDDSAYQRFRDKVSDNYDFMTYYENKYSTSKGLDMSAFQQELANWQARLSAAQSNLSDIRSLAESQYEHSTVSADTRASLDQQAAQNNAYYNYLYSRIKQGGRHHGGE